MALDTRRSREEAEEVEELLPRNYHRQPSVCSGMAGIKHGQLPKVESAFGRASTPGSSDRREFVGTV